jgi:hypothetical protein
MPVNVLMPALSPAMEKGHLTKWFKKKGEKIKAGDVICEIETDKATMEVEAVDEGTLRAILIPEDTADVLVNTPLAIIDLEDELENEIEKTSQFKEGSTEDASRTASTPVKKAKTRIRSKALFVSHTSEDRAVAMEVVSELERSGIRCWITPRDVRPGRPFDDEIVEAIENCRAVLLVFSEKCNESDYIRREITVAGETSKLVIPFRIENCQPKKGLRVRLADLHWIDAHPSREDAINTLMRTLEERRTGKGRR